MWKGYLSKTGDRNSNL